MVASTRLITNTDPLSPEPAALDKMNKNMMQTCDLVKISIGGNFENQNYEQFVSLLDHLIKEGLTPDKIGAIKFDPVSKRPERRYFTC